MTSLAGALRDLASLLAADRSVRGALCDWHLASIDEPIGAVVHAVSRRARLGADLRTAIAPLESLGADGSSVVTAIVEHARHGGSLGAALRSFADVIEERDRALHEARAASIAATLSGRLLAVLATGAVVLVSAWRGIPTATMVVSAGGAAVLTGIGVAWMRRVRPRVPVGDHPVAVVADHAAALLDAGMGLRDALTTAVGQRADADLQDVARLVRLGLPWDRALVRSSDAALRSLGQLCARQGSTGVPVSAALGGFAAALREMRRRELAIEARRAPVLLILPLTLCFLPAFGLVMVVPLLRSITG